MKFLILSAVTLTLGACVSAPEKVTCDQRDWYESGRRDGAQGSTLDKLAHYKRECGGDFNAFWETMYTNGRNAGLVEFCAPENSYELGRMGIAYMYVCPSTTEPEFLAGYRRGQEARKIELENQRLDQEIDSLLTRLNDKSSQYEQRKLASEIEQLRKTRARNERDLEKMNN